MEISPVEVSEDDDDGSTSAVQGGRWGSAVGSCPSSSSVPKRWNFSGPRPGKQKIPGAEKQAKGKEFNGTKCKPPTFLLSSGKFRESPEPGKELAAGGRCRSVRGRLAVGRSVGGPGWEFQRIFSAGNYSQFLAGKTPKHSPFKGLSGSVIPHTTHQ